VTDDPDLAPENDQSCLLFGTSDLVSPGPYLPLAYQLPLRGEDVAQHHLTHLHEIHRKVAHHNPGCRRGLNVKSQDIVDSPSHAFMIT